MLGDTPGADLLTHARELHPAVKRGLMIGWGDWAKPDTADAISTAMTLGKIDYYVLKPQRCPDELFHRTVAEFLFEWARHESPLQGEIEIVAELGSPRAAELRDLLSRNGIPYACHPPESAEGKAILEDSGHGDLTVPIAKVGGGRFIVDPTNVELADAFGVSTHLGEDTQFDVVVIGAGPAGLAAAVYASSEGMRALVDRARGDRRPGRVELADPQLPRFLTRGQRLRPRPARLPAGLGLRDRVSADARGRRAAAGGEAACAEDVGRRPRSRRSRSCSPPESPTGGSRSRRSAASRARASSTAPRRRTRKR